MLTIASRPDWQLPPAPPPSGHCPASVGLSTTTWPHSCPSSGLPHPSQPCWLGQRAPSECPPYVAPRDTHIPASPSPSLAVFYEASPDHPHQTGTSPTQVWRASVPQTCPPCCSSNVLHACPRADAPAAVCLGGSSRMPLVCSPRLPQVLSRQNPSHGRSRKPED